MLQWRVANRRPHASSKRLQKIATFIEKNQASFEFEALFLTAAIQRGANEQWRAPFALEPAAPVSVDSTQACGEPCRRDRRGTQPQTACESGLGPADTSIRSSSTPSASYPVSGQSPTPFAVRETVLAGDLNVDGHEATWCRHVSIFPANGERMKHYIRWQQPLPSMFSLVRKAGLQSYDDLPALRGFLMVSWPQSSRRPLLFH
jgi:hypothetical protein